MKLTKYILFLFLLPITFFLDLLLFTSGLKCASCGSFTSFLSSNSALSFPIIIVLGGFFGRFKNNTLNRL